MNAVEEAILWDERERESCTFWNSEERTKDGFVVSVPTPRTPYRDLYTEICKAETGLPVPADLVEKRARQKRILKEQTLMLATKLEKEGIAAYRDSQYWFYQFYVHSGFLEEIPAFRRIMLLPAVAAAVRAPMLSAVEAFVERNPFCRFWTFTSGERVPVSGLRKRIRYLHRKLSDLNAQPFMQALGVEIVFRSTELGTPECDAKNKRLAMRKWGRFERGANGELFFHPHAHCVVFLRKGRVSAEKWEALFHQIWAFWVHQWDGGKRGESGVIRNARECVKYVIKPAEMLKFTGPELAAVHRALSRLKLAQPMGSLADEIKARKEAGKRLVRVPVGKGEGRVFRDVTDWNRKGEVSPKPVDESKPAQQKAVFRVVSRCLPCVGPAGIKEPKVVIMASYPLTALLAASHPVVAHLKAATLEEFLGGSAISVHTCTSTVPKGPPERPDRPRARSGNRQFGEPDRKKRADLLASR